MCGIAGMVAPDGVRVGLLQRMTDALEHRGPDGSGYLLHQPGAAMAATDAVDRGAPGAGPVTVGFGHRRLAIIDPTAASDQPMIDAAGEFALIYNGELYNYLELRAELARRGHVFRTEGDTEVVLLAYREWGPECVRRFVGMWAFAVLDVPRASLFLSRDRFGIKPLFYAVRGGALHFASEIGALLQDVDARPQPNEEAVRRFILSGRVDAGVESFFRGIFRLPPAHNALVPLDSPATARPARYWACPDEAYVGTVEAAADELGVLLEDTVRLHLRSDVPVGTCLSGGLDSSAIVCIADGFGGEADATRSYAHRGFGYVPREAALSERPHMEQVAAATSLKMTYVDAAPARVVEVIPQIASQQDEPFGTASIAVQWFVFEAARRAGVKVMLDGQGADEVFGGYPSYLPKVARGHLGGWRLVRFARLAAAHRARFGAPPLAARDALASAVPALRRLGDLRARALPPAVAVMAPGLRGRWHDVGDLRAGSVNEILDYALTNQLPALLRFEDRNSMAHSIEARVPFLDHRVVEFAARLPGDHKICAAENKHVLRRALAGTVPAPILARRDKVGFRPDPGITWEFAALHREALLSAHTEFESRWFDHAAVERLIDGRDHSSAAEFALWRVISTKLWVRRHWSEGAALGRAPRSRR